jgi:uncharacterized protein YjbI with pentapeptide repeats
LADTEGLRGREKTEEVDRTRTALLAFLAGALATAGAVYTALSYRLSLSGQITDRFTKAIEHLGHDKALVRLGGIYALERIAYDSKRDHPRIMEVLTAYVRAADATDQGRDERVSSTGVNEIQAALAVIKRRKHRYDQHRLDLREMSLPDAKLPGADLRGVILCGAHLKRADLRGANLSRRQFGNEAEEAADLQGANLTKAKLGGAKLIGAKLIGAKLIGANLIDASLAGADLSRADFQDAILTTAAIKGAKNIELAENLDFTDTDEA